MGIRKISLGFAAAALLGAAPAMAAVPVTPSAAQLTLTPAYGASLTAGSRLGAARSSRSSDITGGAAVIGVLAAAAVVGGVVAATDNGNGHSTSP
jgi:TRAP-type mannitol/chloroaromatic compound transport system substrate-binding protein